MENITEMYSGTVRIKFVESNHSYWISEKKGKEWTPYKRLKGTTTYCGIKDKSTPLKYWVAKLMAKFLHGILGERAITKYDIDEAKGLHAKKLEAAATSGSKVHDWIEEYVKGENPEMPAEEDVLRGVNAFLEWDKKHPGKFLEAETIGYSRKHGHCGTLDAIKVMKGKRYLIDYKTSNGLYNDVMLQTADYSKIYEEMGKGKIYGRWAIRLEKRSEAEFRAEMDEKGLVNAEYVPFEAIYLDEDRNALKEDYEAFLHAKGLKEWDLEAVKKMEEYKSI